MGQRCFFGAKWPPSALLIYSNVCYYCICICICIQLYICVSRSCHPLLSSLVMCPLPEQVTQSGHQGCHCICLLYYKYISNAAVFVYISNHQVISPVFVLYIYISPTIRVHLCVTTMMYTWPCQKVWMYTRLYTHTHSSSIIITELCSLSKEHCTQSTL